MTLEELIKLKEEDYELFIERVKEMNQETPNYLTISKRSLINTMTHAKDPSLKERIKSSMKEIVEKTDFRDQVGLNNKKKRKPYAIYEGFTYTSNELVEVLGISRVAIGNMKSGKFENRFNLEFIDNGRKKLTSEQKNKISNTLNGKEPSYYAVYEGNSYTFNELLEILKIGRGTLFNLKKGKGKVAKYNLIFL